MERVVRFETSCVDANAKLAIPADFIWPSAMNLNQLLGTLQPIHALRTEFFAAERGA